MFSVRKPAAIIPVFLASLLVSLACVEVVLRVIIPHSYALTLLTQSSNSDQNPGDATTMAELRAMIPAFFQPGQLVNGFVTNSQGFVTPEVREPKSPDAFRIVLIGDSFGVGVVPYPKQFIRLTETALRKQTGREVEVINLSLPGIGMREYERLFSLEALKYQPDLVIISFFVGNDFFVENFHQQPETQGKTLAATPSFLEKSKVFLLIKNQLSIQQKGGVQVSISQPAKPGQVPGTYTGEGPDNYAPTQPTLTKETYFSLLAGKVGYFEKGNRSYHDSIQNVLGSVRHLSESSAAVNIPVYFVIIPDELQLYEELFVKAATTPPQHPNYDLSAPQRKLTTQLNSLGIPYLDLLPILATQSGQSSLYIPQDTHLNEVGNEAVSNALIPELIRLMK